MKTLIILRKNLIMDKQLIKEAVQLVTMTLRTETGRIAPTRP